MKRAISCVLILMLLAGLCACGKKEDAVETKPSEGPTQTAEDLTRPETTAETENDSLQKTVPELRVLYEGQSCRAVCGTASWNYPTGNGSMAGYEADGFHPLQNQNIPVITVREGAFLKLRFGLDPDELRIRCWSARYRDDTASFDANFEVIEPAADGTLKVPDGGAYVFEIRAKWLPAAPPEAERACGEGYFAFMTSDPAEYGETADVWSNIDIVNSAVGFGYFNGAQGRYGFFYKESADILESLQAVPAFPADDFTPEKLSCPVYGLRCIDKQGSSLDFFWTNGYLLSGDGLVYRFNYDFDALVQKEFDFGESKVSGVAGVPGSWQVAKDSDRKWISDRMQPVPEKSPAEGVSLILTGREENVLQLELKNETGGSWMYGEDYWLEAELQGNWYSVPAASSQPLVFAAIGYGLEPGQCETVSCSLAPFGDLPTGTYRLGKSISLDTLGCGWVNHQVFTEFTIE